MKSVVAGEILVPTLGFLVRSLEAGWKVAGGQSGGQGLESTTKAERHEC